MTLHFWDADQKSEQENGGDIEYIMERQLDFQGAWAFQSGHNTYSITFRARVQVKGYLTIFQKFIKKIKQHPINKTKKKPMQHTPLPYDVVHVPAKFLGNTAMRL